jgi:hypothetical protein
LFVDKRPNLRPCHLVINAEFASSASLVPQQGHFRGGMAVYDYDIRRIAEALVEPTGNSYTPRRTSQLSVHRLNK